MFVIKEKDCFQASPSYGWPLFGLVDDLSKVAYGNNTCFVEYEMTFLFFSKEKSSCWHCGPGFVNSLLTSRERGGGLSNVDCFFVTP